MEFIAFVALWVLDLTYTFHAEVGAIWRRKITGGSVLFIVSRYGFSIYEAIYMIFLGPGVSSNATQAIFSPWIYA